MYLSIYLLIFTLFSSSYYSRTSSPGPKYVAFISHWKHWRSIRQGRVFTLVRSILYFIIFKKISFVMIKEQSFHQANKDFGSASIILETSSTIVIMARAFISSHQWEDQYHHKGRSFGMLIWHPYQVSFFSLFLQTPCQDYYRIIKGPKIALVDFHHHRLSDFSRKVVILLSDCNSALIFHLFEVRTVYSNYYNHSII